jgi:arsenate reductase
MAEAFFNELARGQALGISAGTQPTDKVNPMVAEAMKEVGIDISNNKPKLLTIDMIDSADRMISMGCGVDAEAVCPVSLAETEDWELEDPQGKPIEQVRPIRDEIKERVHRLVKDIIQN